MNILPGLLNRYEAISRVTFLQGEIVIIEGTGADHQEPARF
jgi:hypothetical protein